ncbi:MAG: sulfatase [Acidobacteriota bacterium]
MTRKGPRWWFARAGALAVAGYLILGCGRPPAESDSAPRARLPRGVVFEGPPVLCLPGREWRADDAWLFLGTATIPCAVRETPQDGWWFELEPMGPTATYRYSMLWDGEVIAELAPEAGPWKFVIPAARLSPGEHQLEIRRQREYRDQQYGANWLDNRFRRIRSGANPESLTGLPPRTHPSVRLLSDFLRFGVVGRGPVKRGGWMFVGPSSRSLILEGPGRLHLRPENLSSRPGRFRARRRGAEVVETEVPAGFATSLELELPAGESHWELSVDGVEHGLFLWSQPRLETSAPGRLPPVVLVTLDTTRRDALTPYGAPRQATPHLARFARRATVWDRAHSTSPWTLPSHASIFTGLYPSRHRAGVQESALNPARRTLAERLRDAGYTTLGFAGGSLSSSRFGVAQGFDYFRDPERYQDTGDVLVRAVRRALEEPLGGPLFLFVNLFDAHAPYEPPEPFASDWQVPAKRQQVPIATLWGQLANGDQRAWRRIRDNQAPAGERELAWLEAAYRAEVAFTDQQVGELFALLESKGLFDDAWVVVTADHGELLGEGGFFSHGARLDPELVEVPLLIKEPRQRHRRRRDGLVSGVDLFPSLLAAAGLEIPPSDGRVLGRDQTHPLVLFEEHRSLVHPLPPAPRVIAAQLFGLQRSQQRQVFWEDGEECRRRSGTAWRPEPCPQGSEVLRRRVLEKLSAAPLVVDPGELPEEEAAALRALGYL